ncbi:MAG: hypothetical protein R3B57_03670 [Phycisphaerales bacterium]
MRTIIASLCACLAVGGLAALAPDPDHNILSNPGFEDGVRDPDAWTIADPPRGVSIRRDNRITNSGKGSLRLSKSADNFFPPAGATQTLDRNPSWHALEVGADVRAVRATKLVLDVQFSGDAQDAHEWAAFIGAANPDDPPVTHDWKHYSGIVAVPDWAKKVTIAVQIWGPGTAWVDDVSAVPVDAPTPGATPAVPDKEPDANNPGDEAPAPDAADAPKGESITIAADARKQYVLYTPPSEAPRNGYKLLIVLPGGDGSAEFSPFVGRVAANALPDAYIVAQAIAPVWSDADDRIVWPTEKLPDENMAFSTERFVLDIIDDVKERHEIDPRNIYILGWSSGGPASYATTLTAGSPIRGALVAMSVFKPEMLPPLNAAAGKAFYILHSPQDFIPMRFPEDARDRLARAGAKTKLEPYEGGHGWHADPFALIRAGVEWLEKNAGG